MVLLKHVLSNQNASGFEMFSKTLELWKNLLQKMSTNPKMYDLSPHSKFSIYCKYLFIKCMVRLGIVSTIYESYRSTRFLWQGKQINILIQSPPIYYT